MFDILLQHNTLVLFGIIFFGIALGSIKIYGLNLGLSGVLFVALAAGHYRLAIPDGVGQLGLALFVYCVGLSAGNRFFSAIAKQGSKLAIMSAVIVGVSALFTCLFGIWFKVPAGISSGIFAGACTSTPALAAATESLPGASGSGVSIGYGIAYPFGVVGVVLFVQLLPRLLALQIFLRLRRRVDLLIGPRVGLLFDPAHRRRAGVAALGAVFLKYVVDQLHEHVGRETQIVPQAQEHIHLGRRELAAVELLGLAAHGLHRLVAEHPAGNVLGRVLRQLGRRHELRLGRTRLVCRGCCTAGRGRGRLPGGGDEPERAQPLHRLAQFTLGQADAFGGKRLSAGAQQRQIYQGAAPVFFPQQLVHFLDRQRQTHRPRQHKFGSIHAITPRVTRNS